MEIGQPRRASQIVCFCILPPSHSKPSWLNKKQPLLFMIPDCLAQGGLVLLLLEDTKLPSPCLPHLGRWRAGQPAHSRPRQRAIRVTELMGGMAGAASWHLLHALVACLACCEHQSHTSLSLNICTHTIYSYFSFSTRIYREGPKGREGAIAELICDTDRASSPSFALSFL